MRDRIGATLRRLEAEDRIGLMTHVVAGYPSLSASRELIDTLFEAGSDLLEIQLPFSDPTADGPVITAACQDAIRAGFRVADGLRLMDDVSRAYPIPFVFMSYYNILFSYRDSAGSGTAAFVRAATKAGASGLIVPDIPPEETAERYPGICRENGIHPIHVISPNVSEKRLHALKPFVSGFVYSTSRTGTTGREMALDLEDLNRFLDRARAVLDLPLAVGFSISSRGQVEALRGHARIAVVGSHLLRVHREEGAQGVKRVVRDLKGG